MPDSRTPSFCRFPWDVYQQSWQFCDIELLLSACYTRNTELTGFLKGLNKWLYK